MTGTPPPPDIQKIIETLMSEHIMRINLIVELDRMAMGVGDYAALAFGEKARAYIHMAARMLARQGKEML